jgi:hypothetical protein
VCVLPLWPVIVGGPHGWGDCLEYVDRGTSLLFPLDADDFAEFGPRNFDVWAALSDCDLKSGGGYCGNVGGVYLGIVGMVDTAGTLCRYWL